MAEFKLDRFIHSKLRPKLVRTDNISRTHKTFRSKFHTKLVWNEVFEATEFFVLSVVLRYFELIILRWLWTFGRMLRILMLVPFNFELSWLKCFPVRVIRYKWHPRVVQTMTNLDNFKFGKMSRSKFSSNTLQEESWYVGVVWWDGVVSETVGAHDTRALMPTIHWF
jgi:hypothetical protein